MFIRVRSAVPGDPLNEFHVPVGWIEKEPDLFEVVETEPVADSRPALIVPGVVPDVATVAKIPAPVKKRPARKDLVKTTAPVGADS